MPAFLRLPLVSAAALLVTASVTLAQGPVGAQPGDAGGAPTAGGVPTLSQQPAGVIPQQDEGPSRAPGSTADQGVAMPKATDDSGTTTTYAPAKTAEEAPWPCAQRKVPTISSGTIWSGPNIDEGKGWDEDNDLAALAQKLASRRTTLEEADGLVKDFAQKAGKDKDKQLTRLFVGVLDIINDNRGQILQGIMRYAQGQERLAERMRDESDKIAEAQSDVKGETGVAVEVRNKDFAWDQRIFQERKQALAYVCETPTILERRAGEIARIIQTQL